ncbi:MAG: RNA polymerase sigma factor [Solirubrobacteraceae bacterium]
MEVSALKYSAGIGLHGRSTLLRLQSDERLIAFIRRGNATAFEVLVARYETRLLAFCRHLLGSREDAEDVLQEAMTAAFNAILADDRPINVRPWLYRIARNRSLNHLRRIQAIGVDSMDHHLSEHGLSTADKVHEREEFRLLVGDIHELPETQKTALVLREMDALSYEQIAEAMETTVSSVKSLLVRARVSLAEAAEARLLTCDEVRLQLAEVAEGLARRPSPVVRRHLRSCERCAVFRDQLRHTNKALAALLPVGPLVMLRKAIFLHLGHSAGAGSSAAGSGAGAGAAGAAGAAGTSVVVGSATGSGGFISAGLGALAAKTAAGIAVTALVTAGAVEVDHAGRHVVGHRRPAAVASTWTPAQPAAVAPVSSYQQPRSTVAPVRIVRTTSANTATGGHPVKVVAASVVAKVTTSAAATRTTTTTTTTAKPAGRSLTESDPTVLPVATPPTATSPATQDPTGTLASAAPPATAIPATTTGATTTVTETTTTGTDTTASDTTTGTDTTTSATDTTPSDTTTSVTTASDTTTNATDTTASDTTTNATSTTASDITNATDTSAGDTTTASTARQDVGAAASGKTAAPTVPRLNGN